MCRDKNLKATRVDGDVEIEIMLKSKCFWAKSALIGLDV